MDAVVTLFAEGEWSRKPGATEDQLAAAEHAVGLPLPEALKAVLRWSNGGHGSIGKGHAYLQLLSAGEITEFQEFGLNPFPAVVCIGSDGSREQFALDYRADASRRGLAAVDVTVPEADGAIVRFGEGIVRLADAGSVWAIEGVRDG